MDAIKLRFVAGSVVLAIVLCVVMSLPASAQVKVTYRSWTSARGDTVNAVMLSCSNGVVQLRKVDGKILKIKSADLSAPDQAYLAGLQEDPAASPGTQDSSGVSTLSAADFLPEDSDLPVATNTVGAQWFIGKAVVCSNFDGHDISNIYTQKFDTFYCYRKVPPGYRLIVVKCVITALAGDPEAVDKLNKLRGPMAEKLPIIGNNLFISDGQRRDLAGKCRLMNATNITLHCESPKKRYMAQWLVLPPAKGGAYFLENGSEKPFFGGKASMSPWYKTCSVQNGFTGLLEVGKPASVALFYGIPADMDPGKLRIEIEGQSGMMLSVEDRRGVRSR